MTQRERDRIERAATAGQDALWAEIARRFPEIKSGDVDPLGSIAFDSAVEHAVTAWVEGNRRETMERTMRLTIDSDVDSLTQDEYDELVRLLEKLGFTGVGIGGGASSTDIEFSGPGLRATRLAPDSPADVPTVSVAEEYRLMFRKFDKSFPIATAKHPDTVRELRRLRENLLGLLTAWDNEFTTLADDISLELEEPAVVPKNPERRS